MGKSPPSVEILLCVLTDQHLATIFTSDIPPSPKLSLMLDTYFPDPDIDYRKPHLYIELLATDKLRQTLSPYRKEALYWQEEHEAAHRSAIRCARQKRCS